jgi:hypothetical protein
MKMSLYFALGRPVYRRRGHNYRTGLAACERAILPRMGRRQ